MKILSQKIKEILTRYNVELEVIKNYGNNGGYKKGKIIIGDTAEDFVILHEIGHCIEDILENLDDRYVATGEIIATSFAIKLLEDINIETAIRWGIIIQNKLGLPSVPEQPSAIQPRLQKALGHPMVQEIINILRPPKLEAIGY
jgi:hypothetical protein